MAPKPTEIRLVVDLLVNNDWDSPEAAARAIIEALDAKRKASDKPWVVVRPDLGLIYGTYPTITAARKAAAKAVSIHHATPERVKVARLFTTLEEGQEQ